MIKQILGWSLFWFAGCLIYCMFLSTSKRKPAAGVQTTISIDGLEDAIQDTKIPKNLVGIQQFFFFKGNTWNTFSIFSLKHLSHKIFKKMLEEERQLTNLFFSSMRRPFLWWKNNGGPRGAPFVAWNLQSCSRGHRRLSQKGRELVPIKKNPMAEDQRKIQSEVFFFKDTFSKNPFMVHG